VERPGRKWPPSPRSPRIGAPQALVLVAKLSGYNERVEVAPTGYAEYQKIKNMPDSELYAYLRKLQSDVADDRPEPPRVARRPPGAA
jgi:hypothetical protein